MSMKAMQLALLGSLVLGLPQAQAEESSWESLPEAVVAGVRVPEGKALAEAFATTRFGTTLFSASRQAAVLKVLENHQGWSEGLSALSEVGLTTQDLWSMLAGESGYAVTLESGESPRWAGLVWLEPGEALARKGLAALAKLIEQQDDQNAVVRVDVTLADQPVMQLQIPEVELEYDDQMGDYEYDEDLSEEENDQALEDALQAWEESAVETVVYRTLLVCQFEGRLLMVHSFQGESEEEAAETAESLSAILGDWIVAHQSGGEGFVQRLQSEATVAQVLAQEGVPMLEILADTSAWVELLTEQVSEHAQAERWLQMLGLESVGSFASCWTVEGTLWRSQMALALPAPRQGLLQWLDQAALDMEPPSWVPAEVVRYYQVSFDLGKAYELFKEAALAEFPEESASTFTTLEMQVQNFAQVSLGELLSSLGNRHTMLSLGHELVDGEHYEETAGQTDEAAETPKMQERLALVWEIEDQALWQRLLQAITPFAGMAPGTEFTEEQGFSGWRMKRGQDEGGLFLGKGYLVLASGTGVLEGVLASLNHPPTGSKALVGSAWYERAAAILDLAPAQGVDLTDGGRHLRMVCQQFQQQLEQYEKMLAAASNAADASEGPTAGQAALFLKLAQTLLPRGKEIEGLLGVIVSRWEINDQGVFAQSAQEMPRP